MFGRKNKKDEVKNAKSQAGRQTAAKKGQTQVKSGKVQAAKKPAAKGKKAPDSSDRVLAKLMEIEKETRLEQARDSVDGLEDEKIAEHIEQLLKIMRSGE